MTGYLTQRGYIGNGYYSSAVPNREIRNIIIERILVQFRKAVSEMENCSEVFAMQF